MAWKCEWVLCSFFLSSIHNCAKGSKEVPIGKCSFRTVEGFSCALHGWQRWWSWRSYGFGWQITTSTASTSVRQNSCRLGSIHAGDLESEGSISSDWRTKAGRERERERGREGGRSWVLLQSMNFAAEIVSLLAGWMAWVDGYFFCLRVCHRSAASGWDEEGRFPGSRTWTQGPTSCMG